MIACLRRPTCISLTAQRSRGKLQRRCSVSPIIVPHEGTSGAGGRKRIKNVRACFEKSPNQGGDNESEQKGNGPGCRGGARGARRLRANQEPGGTGLGGLRQVLSGIRPHQRERCDLVCRGAPAA